MDNRRLPKPGQCPDEFYVVARMCWELEAEDRPTFEELVEMVNKLIQERRFAVNAPQNADENIYDAIDLSEDDSGLRSSERGRRSSTADGVAVWMPEKGYLTPAETRFGEEVYDNTDSGAMMAEVRVVWPCCWGGLRPFVTWARCLLGRGP